MPSEFGALVEVDLRCGWKNEAQDFTPWLETNIKRLNQALGLDIEIIEREGAVGSFSVDLVGQDLSSGHTVVIENQLEPTDHTHLGQLLTYAAGREAKIVIWISPQFRDEHKQALDWLNEHTREDQAFFGVEIKLVRIDSSRPAPLFKLVSQPNEWQKAVSGSKPLSARAKAYQVFWQRFLEKLKEQAPGITYAQKGLPQNWCYIGAGKSGFSCGGAFKEDGFVIELYIDTGNKEESKQIFDQFYKDKDGIEQELGTPLIWERIDNARASRIAIYHGGAIDSTEEELEDLLDWAVPMLIRLKATFGKRIKAL